MYCTKVQKILLYHNSFQGKHCLYLFALFVWKETLDNLRKKVKHSAPFQEHLNVREIALHDVREGIYVTKKKKGERRGEPKVAQYYSCK